MYTYIVAFKVFMHEMVEAKIQFKEEKKPPFFCLIRRAAVLRSDIFIRAGPLLP